MQFNGLMTLPVAVYVALGLFVLKEILEFLRNRKSKSKRLSVYKKILSYECERNNWAIKSIKHIAVSVERRVGAYRIENTSSGRQRFVTIGSEDGDDTGSSILAEVHTSKMEELILEVGIIDEKLAGYVYEALDAVLELKHVRDSIVEYETAENGLEHDIFYEDFWEYVQNEVEDSFKQLSDLYFQCAGKLLEGHRLR